MKNPKELPSLSELEEKIAAAREEQAEKPNKSTAANMSLGWRLVIEFASGIGVGVFIGIMLDRWLDTSPLFLLICLALGTAAGFFNMQRAIRQITKDK